MPTVIPVVTFSTFFSSTFPPLFQPDGTTGTSCTSQAEYYAQTFAINSTLDDSGLLPLLSLIMAVIKILPNDVLIAFFGLYLRKAHNSDGVPSVVLKNCASILTFCLVKLFHLCLPRLFFLL